MQIIDINLEKISTENRKRTADAEKVTELSKSIQEIGLLNPIIVKKDGDNYILIAGLHRLIAFKNLKKDTIPAIISDADDIHSELAEIDENLIRAELHYLDRAEFLKRRQEIYETLYPETKAEEKRKRKPSNDAEFCEEIVSAQKNDIDGTLDTFTEDTAKKTNLTARTIRQDLQLAKDLDEEVKDVIKNKGVSKQDALKLSRMDKGKQKDVAKKIKSGEAKKVSDVQLAERKEEIVKNINKDIQDNPPVIYVKSYADFLPDMPDNEYDLLFTDPPYSTDIDDIESFANDWLPKALSKVKPDGRALIFIGAYPKEILAYMNFLLNKQDKFILDNNLIWAYKNTLGQIPKMKYNLNYQVILHLYSETSRPLKNDITGEMFNVQEFNAPDGRLGNRFHTWQKPLELAERLIRHTTKENDKVLDPFSCTGTFLIAAAKLNRIAVGSEINSEHAKIAESLGVKIVY
jgi:ParB-like chromosome segregation protein Spo0J/DNA modification methylase